MFWLFEPIMLESGHVTGLTENFPVFSRHNMDSNNSFSLNDSLNNSLDIGLPTSDVENILVNISI